MQEVFEKIIEKFQRKIEALGGASGSNEIQDVAVKEIMWCKEIVKQAAEQYNNGWIPCSERLPEESLNSVIGWDAYRERCVFVQYLQGKWKLGNWESVKITHWMNVPEPPKGE